MIRLKKELADIEETLLQINPNMCSAEKLIRLDIENMELNIKYKLAVISDIRYAFFHGFINEYIYKDLLKEVNSAYNKLFDN